jgi:hypothetical protein
MAACEKAADGTTDGGRLVQALDLPALGVDLKVNCLQELICEYDSVPNATFAM